MVTPEPIQTDGASFSLWARRAVAALIAVIFLPIAIFAITFSGARASVSEPDDVIEALAEADIYGYVHDHLVPLALDELFEQTDNDVIRAAEPWTEDVAVSIEAAFPAGEIRDETENALLAVWPYMWGREDEFEVTVAIAPRAARGFDELSRRVSVENPEVYGLLIELIEDRVEEEAAEYLVTSLDLGVIVEAHLPEIAPSDWLFPRLGQAVADVGAYYIGETENSVITIPIDDRAPAIEAAIVDIPGETDLIERAEEIVAEGVTVDAANLTAELSEELFEDPDQLREYIIAGFEISDQTLEDAVGEGNESSLDELRDFLASSGSIQIVLWAVAAAFLFLLAFVGGRGWEGRLTWASVVLGVGAILAWVTVTAPIDLIVRPALEGWTDSVITEFTDDAAVELALRVETFISVLLDVVSDNVRSQAIRVGVVAGVALIIARLLAPDSVGRRAAGR